jgi:hypothetical protein
MYRMRRSLDLAADCLLASTLRATAEITTCQLSADRQVVF